MVDWPAEPFSDWVRSGVRILFVLVLCLVPAGVLSGRASAPGWTRRPPPASCSSPPWPCGSCSPSDYCQALGAGSPWVVLRSAVLGQLLRLAPATLLFYLATASLTVAAAIPWHGVLYQGRAELLPLAAPIGAAALLVYARLLGRLAWLTEQLPTTPPRRRKTKKKRRSRRALLVEDPWAVPPVEEPPPKLPVDGYEIATGPPVEEEERASGPRRRPPKPYAVAAMELPPPPAPDAVVNPLEVAKHLAERSVRVHVPLHPFFSGVYTFPWYASSRRAWLSLSLGSA